MKAITINNTHRDPAGSCEQKCERARPALSLALLATFLLAGCGTGTNQTVRPAAKELTELQATGQQVFARPSWELSPTNQAPGAVGPGAASVGPQRSTWSIVLSTFAGANQEGLASKALAQAREAGLKDAFLEARKDGTALLFGSFDSPVSDKARDELIRVRLVPAGQDPFYPSAMLVAPASRAVEGSIPALDLRGAKQQFGEKVARYTLQVAVYTRMDDEKSSPSELAEFRKAAEDAAVALRREGEQAFYYHGPFGSSVTVGLFSTPDERTGLAAELRKKYPQNLINGQPTKVASPATIKYAQPQRSFIVEVP
ncbi:MAG: hypothetical protein AABZ53_04950 [Planctomycetota bacterium]